MRRIFIGLLLAVLVLVAGLFLTGSAVWFLAGFGNDLRVEGRAERVADGAAPANGQGWQTFGGDAGGARFSAATQITRENVSQLKAAWTYQTRAFEGREAAKNRTAFEATPILVEDKLVLCTPFNDVIALDPGTGEELWRFDPGISIDSRPANQFVCRGVASWTDTQAEPGARCSRRIVSATNDARILSLDLEDGKPCEGFGKGGQIKLEPSLELVWPGEFQITSAPAVVGDVIVTGTAISDNVRVEAPSGAVQAFDARTGERLWVFDPVPRDVVSPDPRDWQDGSAGRTGQANVWSTISVDEKRGWVFLPTSSPSPDFFGGLRKGDNRWANSVVALDGKTGELKWAFQTVHHDVWDYDLPAMPGLYTLTIDGQPRDVVAQVAKTGLVFVLDRDTGEPVLPVEERAVPQDGAVGEALSSTQPFPVNTPAIVPSTLEPGEAFGITGIDKAACAKQIGSARREGLYTPPTEQGTILRPFSGGGANWGGPAFDPARNLLVVNLNNLAEIITLVPADQVEAVEELMHDAEVSPQTGAPYGVIRKAILSPLGLPCSPPPWGVLAAVDLSTGKLVWRRAVGTTRDLAPFDLALPLGVPNLGGPMITGGDLVFLAATIDSAFRAFDVETGEVLWETRLPASAQSGPASYVWEGRQYVVIAAGGYGRIGARMGDYVVAFALDEAP